MHHTGTLEGDSGTALALKALTDDVSEKQLRMRMICTVIKVYTNGLWAVRTRATYCPGGLFKDKREHDGETDILQRHMEADKHKGLWCARGEANEGSEG